MIPHCTIMDFEWLMEARVFDVLKTQMLFAGLAQSYLEQISAIRQAMWTISPVPPPENPQPSTEARQAQPTPSGSAGEPSCDTCVSKLVPEGNLQTTDHNVASLVDAALRKSLKGSASTAAVLKCTPALKRSATTSSKKSKRRR
jgi:hypothetical protein